ncbi:MAG: DUF6273 domain-containing protein [Defluviitaleaceae bacterium]|nr:DUF6273 domain-containing protein [Defluviitaleaceae bacterium]
MKEQVDIVLKNLMKNFGPEIFKDPQRFRGAVLDEPIERHAKKVRLLLCLAICDMKVFTRLLSVNIGALVEEMHGDYEINKEAARIIVQAIARLHNLEERDEEPIKQEKPIEPPIQTTVPKEIITTDFVKESIQIGSDESEKELKPPPLPQPPIADEIVPQQQNTVMVKHHNIGDIINFGQYKWRILKLSNNGTALIISVEIVSKMAYHNRKIGVTWERSDIRKYLNTTFYDKFSTLQRQAITFTDIQNPFNEKYFTQGGISTVDKVFLLSIDEARKYFKTNLDRVAKIGREPIWWWLRSPGSHPDHAAFVYGSGSISLDGEVSLYSYANQNGMRFIGYRVGGVRPAMVINIGGI